MWYQLDVTGEQVLENVQAGSGVHVGEEAVAENLPAAVETTGSSGASTEGNNLENVPVEKVPETSTISIAEQGLTNVVAETGTQGTATVAPVHVPAAVEGRGSSGTATEGNNLENVPVEKGPETSTVPRAGQYLTNAVAETGTQGTVTVAPVHVQVPGNQEPTSVSSFALNDSGIELGKKIFSAVRSYSFNASPYQSNSSYLFCYLQARAKLVNMFIDMYFMNNHVETGDDAELNGHVFLRCGERGAKQLKYYSIT